MDGIVKQLDCFGGIVIECSCMCECMKQNQDLANAPKRLLSTGNSVIIKKCLLSIPEHGERCMAYPFESTTWLIDTDIIKGKQIPTNGWY